MKGLTKKIALMLLVVMTFSALYGCAKKDDSGKAADSGEKKEEEQIKDDVLDAVVPPEDFDPAGEYEDEMSQRAMMTITPDGEDHYQVEITWGGSAYETAVWTFSGDFNWDSGLLSYKDCRKSIITTDDSGQKEKVEYKKGTGALMFYENGFHWQDDKEDTGEGCHFLKVSDLENVAIEEDDSEEDSEEVVE